MRIYTIGFAQKNAQEFFELLLKNKVQRLADIRLRPSGQQGESQQADQRRERNATQDGSHESHGSQHAGDARFHPFTLPAMIPRT